VDAVMEVRKSRNMVMKDAERTVTWVLIDDRKGKESRIEKKVASVEWKLGTKLHT
jgi:uncharacterized protein YqgV (UPF0045/DUF77 family)